jgi:lysophospholipase L1-like esterase
MEVAPLFLFLRLSRFWPVEPIKKLTSARRRRIRACRQRRWHLTSNPRKVVVLASILTAVLASSAITASAQKAPPPKVVFLGDPATYKWGLPANSNAFQANPKWNNQGLIPVQSSSEMLARFQSDVVSYHPAIVHILAGADDISFVDDANRAILIAVFETNMMAMVAEAAHANIKVILGTIPPLLVANSVTQPQFWFVFEPTLIQELNAWIETYGSANNIPVINYHDVLCSCVGSTNPSPSGYYPLMSSDGLSPSPAGYAAITPLVEMAIETLALTLKSGYLGNPRNINSLTEGGSVQLTAYGMYSDGIPRPLLNSNFAGLIGTWSSSNPYVMYVGSNGEAFALSPGEATISFTSLSGVPFSPSVMTVKPAY